MMISVIIPLYNKEQIISTTLESVLSQDYDDFEVIVVNDGSTDRSAEIIRKINDPRIHLVEQENGGPSKARNTGVKYANGKWIVFLDADDELLPGTIRIFADYILKEPIADMLIGEVRFNNHNVISYGCKYKDGFVKEPFKEHYFATLTECTGCMAFRKELCSQYPFDERLWRYEDLQPLFDMYRKCNLFAISQLVVQINVDFASASHFRRDIKEDFLGHLDFKGKSFWETMCLYKLFLGERPYYPNQCKELYPFLYHRYDLLVLNKILSKFCDLTR